MSRFISKSHFIHASSFMAFENVKDKTGHQLMRFQNRWPPFLSNLNNFHSFKVVDRETQGQVSENSS